MGSSSRSLADGIRRYRRLAATLFFGLCAWWVLTPGALAARPVQLGTTISLGELRVVVTTPVPAGVGRGYAPVNVRVTNDGTGPERLEMDLNARRYNQTRYRQKWKLDLAPGESTSSELLVCVDRSGLGGSYRLNLKSGRDKRDVRLEFFRNGLSPVARVIAFVGPSEMSEVVLAGRRSDLPMSGSPHRVLGAATDASRVRSGGAAIQTARLASLSFEDLPRMAAGWSTMDTVFVDVDGDLPSDPRWERLLEWAHQGGQVAFVGTDLERRLRGVPGLTTLTQERFKLNVPEGSLTASIRDGSAMELYRAGFGSIALCRFGLSDVEFLKDPAPTGSDGGVFVRTLQAFDAVRWHRDDWPSTLGALYASSTRDVKEPWTSEFSEDGLPIRSVLGLLTLFAIIVGPLSVAVSRKKKRPGLLLVAVPLVSLVATVVIVGYGLFRQGFGTEGYAHSLTIVDQVEKRATSALRRELVMGRSGQTLQPLPSSTVLVPMRDYGSQTRIMEHDGNQLALLGDFLPVRTRTGHVVLSTGTTRARLEWTAPQGDSMEVTNALGVELRMLEIMSPDGRLFAAEGGIKKGATATLRERPRAAVRGVLDSAEFEPIFAGAQLHEGGYLALASEAGPGADDASVEMDELKFLHAIVGYLDTDPAKWSR